MSFILCTCTKKKLNTIYLYKQHVTCHISIIVHVAFNNVASMHAADRTSQKQNIAYDYQCIVYSHSVCTFALFISGFKYILIPVKMWDVIIYAKLIFGK